MDQRPKKTEELFLTLGYNRFYDLFEEVIDDRFWLREASYRFCKISQAYAIYAELLGYEAFQFVFKELQIRRPPMEAEIGEHLFKFIRNVLAHFPLFETWDQVWISKKLVNWQKEGLSIDKFLTKYSGHEEVKYRFWEEDKKLMTYLTIQFPPTYDANRIYLKDIITEKEGVKFSFIMMKKILNTQVVSIS